MKVFVAGVSSERQFVTSLDSFEEITIQPGDERKKNYTSRGDYARAKLCDEFLRRKEFNAIFLADLDMVYPQGVLEQLRFHDLDMVTGHYFKRKNNPIESIVSISSDGTWPYYPLLEIPDDGLHEIACTGFGNVLIKREVVEAVKKMVPRGSPVFGLGPLPEMTNGDHGHFGADYRFFTLAKWAGYQLYLDASPKAEAKHAATFWIDRDLYEMLRPHQSQKRADDWKKNYAWNLKLHGQNPKTMEALAVWLENLLQEVADGQK